MANRIGERIGNYRLTQLLGHGSIAEVYLGEHINLKNQVAIKLLHVYLTDDEVEVKEDFQREAQLAANLEHAHIIRIREFGFENTTPFLVMDYAPHGNLRKRHPKGSSVPPEIIMHYVKQIASALQYAHNQKMIHCDVKPENILLGRDDHIFLGDFGIALIIQSSHSLTTQNPAGTPIYMAPEQFKGKPCFGSDQYALGVMVYEWLCGYPPFKGKGFLELMDMHQNSIPPFLQLHTSPKIEKVVLKALEKDPVNRFESVQAFAHALEEALERMGEYIPSEESDDSEPKTISETPQKDSEKQPENLQAFSDVAEQTLEKSEEYASNLTKGRNKDLTNLVRWSIIIFGFFAGFFLFVIFNNIIDTSLNRLILWLLNIFTSSLWPWILILGTLLVCFSIILSYRQYQHRILNRAFTTVSNMLELDDSLLRLFASWIKAGDHEVEIKRILAELLRDASTEFQGSVYRASILLPSPDTGGKYLKVWASIGMPSASIHRIRFYVGDDSNFRGPRGVAGEAFLRRQTYVAHMMRVGRIWKCDNPHYTPSHGDVFSPPYHSFVCMPIVGANPNQPGVPTLTCLGVVCFDSGDPKVFDDSSVHVILQAFARRIAAALLLYQQLK